jgi:hexosaminidase
MNVPPLIPRPARVDLSAGFFNPALIETEPNRREFLEALVGIDHKSWPIKIDPADESITGSESYRLVVAPDGFKINASAPAGAFYGLQSLRQLIAAKTADGIPCLTIHDQPRYRWRGIMLDCCRHFFSVDFIKRFIDLLASYKFNVLHWHLTEDQGWRIEIKKYPKLGEIAAWRTNADGTRYGGYYTQDQIREIVAHAASRHVTVVPEIELPGHALAALSAYPELSCTGGPFATSDKWGVFEDVCCAGKESVFTFLQDVLTEVLDLFPSPFIHIGGDECPKTRWQSCPDCQARIKAEGLADEHELQSYFVKRIDRFLTQHGRRLIGWDEILEGGLAANAAVMAWRNPQGAIAAARAGHDVVMSPVTHCYLDYYQSKSPNQPKAIGGYLPIETVYAFDPTPTDLADEHTPRILGGQGNIWTEYMPTEQQVNYMTWPRALALSEALWSAKDQKDWKDFTRRLPAQLERLKSLGVNYFEGAAE